MLWGLMRRAFTLFFLFFKPPQNDEANKKVTPDLIFLTRSALGDFLIEIHMLAANWADQLEMNAVGEREREVFGRGRRRFCAQIQI